MKIQYASDLHLEFAENRGLLEQGGGIVPVGDVLVLAGDVSYLGDLKMMKRPFFDWCSEHYRETFIVPGNHEFYGGYDIAQTMVDYEYAYRENVRYLNNTSVLLDDKILIDFTLSAQDMLPEGIRPKIIFYTHSHGDHFQPIEALKAGVRKVYLNETILPLAESTFAQASWESGIPVPEFVPMKYGQKVTEEGIRFTALPANHATGDLNENAQIYLIEKDFNDEGIARIRVVYATDTGGIMGRASRMACMDRHVAGIGITGLVMESTMGMDHDEDFRIFNHSSAKLVQRTADVLLDTGRLILPEGQPVYLTHMAKSLNPSQEEMDRTLPWPLRAAYDGLEVVFR